MTASLIRKETGNVRAIRMEDSVMAPLKRHGSAVRNPRLAALGANFLA